MNFIPGIVDPVECWGTAGRAKLSSTLGDASKSAGSTLVFLYASLGAQDSWSPAMRSGASSFRSGNDWSSSKNVEGIGDYPAQASTTDFLGLLPLQ
jgi:hypothetical protein